MGLIAYSSPGSALAGALLTLREQYARAGNVKDFTAEIERGLNGIKDSSLRAVTLSVLKNTYEMEGNDERALAVSRILVKELTGISFPKQ